MEKQKQALAAITAWRQLLYDGLLNEKEAASIKKKINTRYKEFLSPIR